MPTLDANIKRGLKKLQTANKEMYGETTLDKALPWLKEEVRELGQAVKKKDKENIKEELAQVLMWCVSIANICDLDLAEIVDTEFPHHIKKYPNL